MPIERRDQITRQMLRDEPKTLFVFGDNMQGRGLGGQAKEMRGEPNAVGIPTKYSPSMAVSAFFDDSIACFDAVMPTIINRIEIIAKHLESGGNVVFPTAGIGTGLAELEKRAPQIWMSIQLLIETLEQ